MADIHIAELVKTKTQREIAEIMGVTQGAVFQALAAKRKIYFRECPNGHYEFYEIKLPRKRKAA